MQASCLLQIAGQAEVRGCRNIVPYRRLTAPSTMLLDTKGCEVAVCIISESKLQPAAELRLFAEGLQGSSSALGIS